MSERTGFVTPGKRAIGDVVVDGLLSGLLAGAVMGIFMVAIGLLGGTGPGQTLGRFDPAGSGAPLTGTFMHLAVSGLYGVGLALLRHALGRRGADWRRYGWLLGASYGLLVWLVAQFVLLPGLGISLAELPPAQLIAAHLIYGAVLGHMLGRHQPV
jgi:hypothetical protein